MNHDLFNQPKIIISPGRNIDTDSPINKKRLTGQNYRLLKYLCEHEGNKIHCFSPVIKEQRIGILHSRVSDIKNKHKIDLKNKSINTVDFFGEPVCCKEYWLEGAEIKRVREMFEIV